MSAAATERIEVRIMANTTATCTQCGKPAFAYLETEQGRTRACRLHARLALMHFGRVHGISG